jgi:hypothetical protein
LHWLQYAIKKALDDAKAFLLQSLRSWAVNGGVIACSRRLGAISDLRRIARIVTSCINILWCISTNGSWRSTNVTIKNVTGMAALYLFHLNF